MVHVIITGPIGHLSNFFELLPLDPGGPELHRIASKLEERWNVQSYGNSTR